jgi:hypothetical protein
MYAIASVLNSDTNKHIHDIWDDLECQCSLNAVKVSPIPHFSWFTYQRILDEEALGKELLDWANSLEPFSLNVNGLGFFPGEHPVVYLPIVRTYMLSALHIDLMKRIQPLVEGTSNFYTHKEWMPHITLAIHDLTMDNLPCVIKQCLQYDLSFEFYVDHIAILYMDEVSFGLQQKFNFGTRKYNFTNGGRT